MDGRTCPDCGRDPSLGIEANPQPAAGTDFGMPSTAPVEREKHSLRKRRKNYFMAKLLLGWSLVLALIIFGARRVWNEEQVPAKPPVAEATRKNQPSEEEIAFINETAPACNQTFAGFLTAGTPEGRNQFVLAPVTTASRMARFYSLNPLTSVDPQTLALTQSAQLDLPRGKALEAVWKSTDGRQFDAVFVKEGGEWRLDWDHFVRFSEYPWPLFLAGSGEPEGEFRLLARERLAEERKNADTISIVLYAPRFGSLNETGIQSPEFLIRRDSENGKLLDAAFKLERKGENVFGVKIANVNPEGLIRVRAKVRRVEADMERHFELEKIIACHWYSVDEPGVEIAGKPAEK